MDLGVWVNPNLSLAGNDPFRISAEIMGGNYSMIWHQLIRDDLAINRVRGCFMLDEEACFRQTGQRAIDWTRENHPNHPEYAQVMEASVASVLAQRFPEEPEPPEPPEPPPEPPAPPEPPEPEPPEPEPPAECQCEALRTALEQIRDLAQSALDENSNQ